MSSSDKEIPNPPPEKSQLPDYVLDLAINLDDAKKTVLSSGELASLLAYRRAANFIAAAMIFLKENALFKRPVQKSDIKPRLLGHWGTCTPLNCPALKQQVPVSRSSTHTATDSFRNTT
jgi:xylulose-5-phosphate/fructose-6-phosphate phosphoketolase